MAINVLSWNVADALSDHGRMPNVVNAVISGEPDVGVFSEAYRDSKSTDDILEAAIAKLKAEGYDIIHGSYEDSDDREDRHGMLAISRVGMTASITRLSIRNAVELQLSGATLEGVSTTLYGVHGDDRREQHRLVQYGSLGNRVVAMSAKEGLILAGDANCMHGSDGRSRLLRAVRPLTAQLPHVEPVAPGIKSPIRQRLISVASRITEMADGGTVALLGEMGLQDADTQHYPTMPARFPVIQIDRIMTNNVLRTSNHRVHERHPGSDHRAISVRIHGRQ
jgi:endonuclease/exonuclease/phosphatase family metal-dependent hydrolase